MCSARECCHESAINRLEIIFIAGALAGKQGHPADQVRLGERQGEGGGNMKEWSVEKIWGDARLGMGEGQDQLDTS